MQEKTRIEWTVIFSREDGDDWPDFTDYGGNTHRPYSVTIGVVAQPDGTAPQVYHADVHGYRVLKRGGMGAAWSRGWAGHFVIGPDIADHMRAPDWITALAQRALDSVTTREGAS